MAQSDSPQHDIPDEEHLPERDLLPRTQQDPGRPDEGGVGSEFVDTPENLDEA